MKTKINEVINALLINANTTEKADRLFNALPFINRICAEIGWDKSAKHLAGCVLASAVSHFQQNGPNKFEAANLLSIRRK